MSYPLGTRLVFADSNATVSHGQLGTCTGTVNGPPLCDEDGTVFYVPVFAERDNGREATTVFVQAKNIIGEAA